MTLTRAAGVTASGAAGLGRRVGRPKHLIEGTRWLFAVFAVLSLAVTAPAPVAATGGRALLPVLVVCAVLTASWLYSYASRTAPLGLDLVDAVCMAAFLVISPGPSPYVLGIVFGAIWFRSLYGSRLRGLLRCVLYAGVLAGGLRLWPLVHGDGGPTPAAAVLGAIPIMFLTVLVAQQLAAGLFAREQANRRDAALAAAGTQLLGLTDPDRIIRLGWRTAADICAATPGLRLIGTLREDAVLRVIGVAGEFTAVPTTLPTGVAPPKVGLTETPAVADSAPLNATVKPGCEWLCAPLPSGQDQGWMFLGAPGRVPPEAVVAVRSMMNQVALALRSAQAHGELRTQARSDALTGLANRSSFTSALRAALDLGVAGSASVLFIDLDDFKNVNDVLGHAAGDELLRQVAARLRECTRPGDVCARLGGDEFAILLEDRTGSTAMAVAQRLVEAVGAPVRLQGQVARVGASVGVTHATNETDVEQLVQQADVAMYAAKANGKNRVQAFETGLLRSDGRAKLERQLANAAADGELVVHYQPIMSLSDGRCVAVEALVRWQHPERGLLQPDDFIEIAERTGAIIDIGDLVLRSACAQASAWRAEHPDSSLAVHVNVAAAQLIDGHFAETVTQCMAEHSIAPGQLVLEIAESVVLDLPTAIARVNDLVGLGATIAIDDFGTGYSALTTLRMLPVHIVKIDESFIAGSPSNRADQAVVEAIVQMAGRLELRTIAEGVERLDQQQFLRTVGADSAQGHLYLRPSPAEDFAQWLRTHLAGAPAAASDRPTVLPLKPRRIG